jgi:hypothetical protein|tara:strand:+ start:316 stop:603 length:288 start_codon:yes stop_codon:yes gene_type:complete
MRLDLLRKDAIMNATRFYSNLNPPGTFMKKASATSKWEISLTDEERKLICNSGKWALIYKADVCGGKELEKVQALWRSIREKLGEYDDSPFVGGN